MRIVAGLLEHPQVRALLAAHLAGMAAITPAGSMHALDLARLATPDITFWSAWDGDVVMGCAALKQIDAAHGEVKSMRTADAYRRRGVAAALLRTVIDEATRRGYARLSLETGASPHFAAAHALYRRAGFVPCAPFAGYTDDPLSAYFALDLTPPPPH
ncbi:GNAT family N-acetyltransferase [Tolypothrix campylonemoides VB511288]|nr:GNAT family N-acetyltransferase [Tolypothrix campylonemoides VB511288]